MEAEAKGINEILSKQADGFRKLVAAAGEDSKDAVMIMIANKLPDLVKLQADAIKNIKIDKVTVWDSGSGKGKDGKTNTADFISGVYGSIPPLQEMFNMAGMDLPEYLKGKDRKTPEAKVVKSPPPKKEGQNKPKGNPPKGHAPKGGSPA